MNCTIHNPMYYKKVLINFHCISSRLNEHIPKCILRFIDDKTKIKTKAVVNATKRSSIAEHLVNNTNCANNYDSSRFKILNSCTSSIDLVRMEQYQYFSINLNFVSRMNSTIKFLYLFNSTLVNLF